MAEEGKKVGKYTLANMVTDTALIVHEGFDNIFVSMALWHDEEFITGTGIEIDAAQARKLGRILVDMRQCETCERFFTGPKNSECPWC